MERDSRAVPMATEWYHGCHVASVFQIMETGFKPTFGTGCPEIQEHVGAPVPGVFLADSWSRAMGYPIYTCTGKKTKCTGPLAKRANGKQRWIEAPGGTLVSTDGTLPFRAVFRCLVRNSSHLWIQPKRGTRAVETRGHLHHTLAPVCSVSQLVPRAPCPGGRTIRGLSVSSGSQLADRGT